MNDIIFFEGFVNDTDFELLRKQKKWLVEQNCPEAEGLLSFLDYFQDMLVDNYNYPEEIIFGEEINEDK